jgi:hypothetical protein
MKSGLKFPTLARVAAGLLLAAATLTAAAQAPAQLPARTAAPAPAPAKRSALGRLPPFVSDFSIATELYSDGLGDVGSQRSAALSESAGCELNASFACGAFSCSTLISRSNCSAMGGRVRRPAPITMTS